MKLSKNPPKIIPVILSGGKGTRLWPLSRSSMPKQFLHLNSEEHRLIQETAIRVSDRDYFEAPVVICNEQHRFLVDNKLNEIGIRDFTIILEPCARDTASAVAASAVFVAQKYKNQNCYMLVLPADHIIHNPSVFVETVTRGLELVQKDYLVTFGITPDGPEVGFGYIKMGKAKKPLGFEVQAFVEKPPLEKAKEFVKSKQYVWNAGIFMFSAESYLQELKKFEPDLARKSIESFKKHTVENNCILLDAEVFSSIKSKSIDYAVMEKTDRAAVIPMDCGWNDAGSWEALWEMKNKDADGNVIHGSSYNLDTKDCYIKCNEGPLVATIGVKDLVIISTKDCIMVAHKNRSNDVKKLVEIIHDDNQALVDEHREVYRPWGYYDTMDRGERHLVRRITVKPGERLSLQKHYHRSEHWIVVKGTAEIECNGERKTLTENQSMYIPSGAIHRIENPGKIVLEIIEVQTGSHLSDDDVVRYEDSYGRPLTKIKT